MTACNSSVAEWIQNQLTLAGTPPIERVYGAIRAAYLRAVESNNQRELSTTGTLADNIGLRAAQIGRYVRDLQDDGRVRSFRTGKYVYYVPADLK